MLITAIKGRMMEKKKEGDGMRVLAFCSYQGPSTETSNALQSFRYQSVIKFRSKSRIRNEGYSVVSWLVAERLEPSKKGQDPSSAHEKCNGTKWVLGEMKEHQKT